MMSMKAANVNAALWYSVITVQHPSWYKLFSVELAIASFACTQFQSSIVQQNSVDFMDDFWLDVLNNYGCYCKNDETP